MQGLDSGFNGSHTRPGHDGTVLIWYCSTPCQKIWRNLGLRVTFVILKRTVVPIKFKSTERRDVMLRMHGLWKGVAFTQHVINACWWLCNNFLVNGVLMKLTVSSGGEYKQPIQHESTTSLETEMHVRTSENMLSIYREADHDESGSATIRTACGIACTACCSGYAILAFIVQSVDDAKKGDVRVSSCASTWAPPKSQEIMRQQETNFSWWWRATKVFLWNERRHGPSSPMETWSASWPQLNGHANLSHPCGCRCLYYERVTNFPWAGVIYHIRHGHDRQSSGGLPVVTNVLLQWYEFLSNMDRFNRGRRFEYKILDACGTKVSCPCKQRWQYLQLQPSTTQGGNLAHCITVKHFRGGTRRAWYILSQGTHSGMTT